MGKAVSFFHGMFTGKSQAVARANKLKREGAVTRILTRNVRAGSKAKRVYIVQTIRRIRRG